MEVYLIKSGPLIVRLDPEETNQGVKLLHAVHHGRPCQTEAVSGLQAGTCARRDSDPVFDTLRLVENDPVELARYAQEGKLLPHRSPVVIRAVLFNLLIYPFIAAFHLGCKRTVGCEDNIKSPQIVPAQLSALTVDHVSAQSMAHLDLCSDLLFPLTNKSNRADDKRGLERSKLGIH
jgi:hypothetical protein